jgi:hypothetical protein
VRAAEPPPAPAAALLFQVFDIIAASGGRQGAAGGLHLYGRTAAGQGDSLQVSGFEPYFYVRLGGPLDDSQRGRAGRTEALGAQVVGLLNQISKSNPPPSLHSYVIRLSSIMYEWRHHRIGSPSKGSEGSLPKGSDRIPNPLTRANAVIHNSHMRGRL